MQFSQARNTPECTLICYLSRAKSHCQSISYDDLLKNHQITYVAGGAAQNAARGAAVSMRTYRLLLVVQRSCPVCPTAKLGSVRWMRW